MQRPSDLLRLELGTPKTTHYLQIEVNDFVVQPDPVLESLVRNMVVVLMVIMMLVLAPMAMMAVACALACMSLR